MTGWWLHIYVNMALHRVHVYVHVVILVWLHTDQKLLDFSNFFFTRKLTLWWNFTISKVWGLLFFMNKMRIEYLHQRTQSQLQTWWIMQLKLLYSDGRMLIENAADFWMGMHCYLCRNIVTPNLLQFIFEGARIILSALFK